MTYLETHQNEVQAAKEEVRRLRTKMKTFERYLLTYWLLVWAKSEILLEGIF